MVKPTEDIHRQHINNTKNAGSSLANWDFVSKKKKNIIFTIYFNIL